jgi:hypothetical protein
MITISLIVGPLIIYTALYIILQKYMTEKRYFVFKDKCILTVGGFVILASLGFIFNNIVLLFISAAFLMHILILIYPFYKKLWRHMLNGNR